MPNEFEENVDAIENLITEPEGEETAPEEGEETAPEEGEKEGEEKEGEEKEEEEKEGEVETAAVTLKDLSEAMEVDTDSLMNNLTVEVDGKPLTLKELTEAYNQVPVELQQEQETYRQTLVNAANNLSRDAFALQEYFQTFDATLQEAVNSSDMVQLRSTDPAEWAAKNSEFQHQREYLNALRVEANRKFEISRQQMLQETAKQGWQELQRDIPGFNQDNLKAAQEIIRKLGFSEEEVMNTVDARAIKAAYLIDKLVTEVTNNRKEAEKRSNIKKKLDVNKLKDKKILAPNAKNAYSKGSKQNNAVKKELTNRLRSSNSLDDAARLIEMSLE